MYEVIRDVIRSKDFELRDILNKINTVWLRGDLTEEQMTELTELARNNARTENSYAPLQEQIDNAISRIDKLEERITKLETTEETGEEEPTEPDPAEEYPEYKQPTGAHDAYNTGDKITYNSKKYICKMDGCVWSPDTYPAGWEEVVENKEDNEESEVTE